MSNTSVANGSIDWPILLMGYALTPLRSRGSSQNVMGGYFPGASQSRSMAATMI